MQAPLLNPIQTDPPAQRAPASVAANGPPGAPTGESTVESQFSTHLEQGETPPTRELLAEREPKQCETESQQAEFAERGQDAPKHEGPDKEPAETHPDVEAEEPTASLILQSGPAGLPPVTAAALPERIEAPPTGDTGKPAATTSSQVEVQPEQPRAQPNRSVLRDKMPNADSQAPRGEEQSPTKPRTSPVPMQPSAEQPEKLQSEHVRHAVEAIPTKARSMHVAGKGPLPTTHRPVHQYEPAKAFDRGSQRGERAAPPRAHVVQGRSFEAVRQVPDTPLQQKLPEGPMRSLAQLLDEGSIRLGATSERRADPAITRAMQVQQAIDSEHVGQAAPVDRPALPMQPVNPLASVPGGQGVASDVRGAVLSEVLARSPEGAPADSRTTMITARGLTALASQRGGTLAIRLDPPSLGEVAIRMSVIDGVVRAELTAASSAARALMEKGIEFLRASLESRGLTVERLSIQGPITTSESHSARSESQQQGGTREEGMNQDRHDAAGHESRGRGGEQRSRTSDGHEDSRGARNSFKQVLAEDTT